MEALLSEIKRNPTRDANVPPFTKESIRQRNLGAKELLWGAGIRRLTPARLTTAWLTLMDPLMLFSGDMYRANQVREKEFALEKDGVDTIRGKRKLSKKAVGEALGAANPTADQRKVFAGVLFECKQIQTLCYDLEKRTIWTYPEDLRAWSSNRLTCWVDSTHEQMLDWDEVVGGAPSFGIWLSEREAEGWTIPWPDADMTMEELKAYVREHDITVRPLIAGEKVKKVDYSRCVGRAQTVAHLSSAATYSLEE